MPRSATVTSRGFTLVELMVVVLILAILAGAAVMLSTGLVTDSAETANRATIKDLTNQVGSFYQAHGRLMPEGLDSLVRDDFATMTPAYAAIGAKGFQYCTNPARIFSCGLDLNQDGVTDAGAKFKGVSNVVFSGAFHSLTLTPLTATDLAALNSIGISYVFDLKHDEDALSGNVPYVKRTLAVGQPVAAFDPNVAGQNAGLWTSFGITQSTAALKADAARFFVFGIGPKSAMIGDRRGGLQEAPVCPVVAGSLSARPGSGMTSYYNRYLVAIRMPNDATETPKFVGILDAMGFTAAAGASWATRTE